MKWKEDKNMVLDLAPRLQLPKEFYKSTLRVYQLQVQMPAR